jgi:uncharacterized protein YjbJ (UPF0337 family)
VGALDDAKGRLKEAAGSITGSDDLRKEGQAQQKKGQEEAQAEKLRAQAQAHEAKAEGAEDVEAKHQGPSSDA